MTVLVHVQKIEPGEGENEVILIAPVTKQCPPEIAVFQLPSSLAIGHDGWELKSKNILTVLVDVLKLPFPL